MKKIINTNNAPGAVGPYSQAIDTGNTLYVSGQLPIDPDTGAMIEDDVQAQTAQSLTNLKAIITEAGYDLDQVVKCTCFLQDMSHFALFNEVYARYLGESAPARVCVEVARLPFDALVEVEAICSK